MKVSQKKLFCFGYGYVAHALKGFLNRDLNQALLKENPPPTGWSIEGTTRTARQPPSSHPKNQGALLHIYNAFEKTSLETLKSFTHFLISIPPDSQGDVVLRDYYDFFKNALHDRRKDQLEWIGYLSSTSVYGNHDGRWVTEESCLKPSFDQAHHRIQAEHQWLSLAKEAGLPLYIFRLSGIYGPGRSAVDRVKTAPVPIVEKENTFFSRCHVDDICQALKASFSCSSPPGFHHETREIFNIADDYPCSSAQVLRHAYHLLNRPCPIPIKLDNANLSERAQQFYQDSKKVSNEKLKKVLRISLLHPTYKEGLQACLAAQVKGED